MMINEVIEKKKWKGIKLRFKICICCLCLFVFHAKTCLTAQMKLNLSATINYELTEGYFPGYDFTILVNESWGIRMTHLPDFKFLETGKPIANSSSVTVHEIKGDLDFPMALKLIDYMSYQNNTSIPFDYLTAYVGMGYNKVNPKRVQRKFISNGTAIVEQRTVETVEIPVTAFAFGFYGGQRFLVIDGRIMYLKGTAEKSNLVESKHEFSQWLLLFSIGIGF